MNLGPLELQSNYILAPIAGYTDKPFRKIAKEFGAGLTYSELISSNAIYYKNKKTYKLIEKNDNEYPFSIQLFGYDADIFLYAAQSIEEYCDCVDINAGCPVNKVIKNFSGAYLLKDRQRLFSIIDKLKRHLRVPLSIKLRKGFSNDQINSIAFYKELENRGIDYLTIHGRTKEQYFSGDADYAHIRDVKDALNIEVIANGGLNSYKKIKQVQSITHCNFFMIGQSALRKPYIFENMINGKDSEKSGDFLISMMKRHLTYMEECYAEDAVKLFRKFFHRYIKGFRNAKYLNLKMNECSNLKEAFDIIERLQV